MTKIAMVFLSLTTILVLSNYLIVVADSGESNTLVFQGATVTANLKEAPLKTVFEKVQKETGIWFRVVESELDERVSIKFENLSVKEGLKRILRTMNYSFLFDQDDNILWTSFSHTGPT
jgi:type II secretory pathway component GspD/PulD (secretin)